MTERGPHSLGVRAPLPPPERPAFKSARVE
jgi:hypothetical protein